MNIVEFIPGQGGKRYDSEAPEQDLLQETLRNHRTLLDLSPSFKPKIIVPNSYGLYAALVIAGVVSSAVALDLARRRAELVARAEEKMPNHAKTGMLAVIGKDVQYAIELAQKYSGIELTNYNGPLAHVLSGPRVLLEKIAEEIKKPAIPVQLFIEAAYHHSVREPESREYADIVRGYDFREPDPEILVVSSTNPRVLSTSGDWVEELVGQMPRPVKLEEAVKLARHLGGEVGIDNGPTSTMKKLVRRIDPSLPVHSLEEDPEQVRTLITQR